ncbi:Phox homologous domain [Phytophthora cinnamomi]|uniref:Phox homologous domain n=1 Tax=Phytophthora cinnamomi TaxID=4785 RepID=UPI0035595C07|nr:Phox homologous domain [Phytophthora cinnamomi]
MAQRMSPRVSASRHALRNFLRSEQLDPIMTATMKTTLTAATAFVVDHECPHQMQKLQKLIPHDCAIVVAAKGGEDVELPAVARPQGMQQRLQLDLEAHRRWNTSLSVGFLNSVDRVEINETRVGEDKAVRYALEVYLSLPASRLPASPCDPADASSPRHHATRPTFKVERCFAEFETLREDVLSAVSTMPQCTCQYCMDFLVYIRYKYSQPRGIVKLTAGTEKRRQILTAFINDFVIMGQRRAPKLGKRKCEAQKLVPAMLEAFLLNNAQNC